MSNIATTGVRVSDKIIKPSAKIKGLGDVIALITQPIAKTIDAVAGTHISTCGGCAKRQQSLNEILPFENKQDT